MKREVLLTLAVRILLMGAGCISSIITARMLGPEGRGIYFYWMTLAGFAIQFGNLGLHASNTYLLTQRGAKLSTLAQNSMLVSVAGGVAVGSILTLFVLLGGQATPDQLSLLWPTLLMIPAGLYFLLGSNLLVAQDRIDEYNIFELINRYLGLAAIFVAAWLWRSVQPLLVATSVVALLVSVLLQRRLRALGGAGRPDLNLLRVGFGYAARAYLASVVAFMVLRLNALLLEHYMDASILGIWSIAAQLLDVIVIIPSTIGLILLPKIMRSGDAFNLMKSQIRVVTIIMVIVCCGAILFGRSIITLVYGSEFVESYQMLLAGLPGVFSLGLTSIVSQYIAAIGIPVATIWIWIFGFAVEASLAIWLIPALKGVGAMLSLSVAYIVIFVLIWILVITHKRRQRGILNA